MPAADKRLRLIPALAGSALIVCWCAVSLRFHISGNAWYSAGGDLEAVFAIEASPPVPSFLAQRAEELADNVFPPDLDRSEEDLRNALLHEPQYSRAWLTLSRVRLYENRTAEARSALEHSERLDPAYPSGRLESVSLWKMLGENERALTTARQVAVLGRENAVNAITELLRNGFTTDEVLKAVLFERLTTEQRQLVLGIFAKERLEAVNELATHLTSEDLESPLLRQQLAPVLMRPLDAPLLGEVWGFDRPGLRLIEGRLLVENPGLEQPAFPTAFPMGWQIFAGSEASTTWEQGSGGSRRTDGHIRLALPRYLRREVSWTCYRFLADVGEEFTVTMHLVPSSSRYARVSLAARAAGTNLKGDSVEVTGESPFDLAVQVPALDEPGLVSLTLAWKPLTSPTATRSDELLVDGFSIRLTEETVPGSAVMDSASGVVVETTQGMVPEGAGP